MNIKVNFISKLTRAKGLNEIVFVKGKKIKSNILNPVLKSVLDNKLFQDLIFLQKEYKNADYIFINCKKLSTPSDYENIGSKLFDYLKKNKIENTYIDTNKIDINHIQLERVIHGAKLKSYNFNNLFAYSSGCKIFPGSETKSLVKKTPSNSASIFFLKIFDLDVCLPTIFKFIFLFFLFFDL